MEKKKEIKKERKKERRKDYPRKEKMENKNNRSRLDSMFQNIFILTYEASIAYIHRI